MDAIVSLFKTLNCPRQFSLCMRTMEWQFFYSPEWSSSSSDPILTSSNQAQKVNEWSDCVLHATGVIKTRLKSSPSDCRGLTIDSRCECNKRRKQSESSRTTDRNSLLLPTHQETWRSLCWRRKESVTPSDHDDSIMGLSWSGSIWILFQFALFWSLLVMMTIGAFYSNAMIIIIEVKYDLRSALIMDLEAMRRRLILSRNLMEKELTGVTGRSDCQKRERKRKRIWYLWKDVREGEERRRFWSRFTNAAWHAEDENWENGDPFPESSSGAKNTWARLKRQTIGRHHLKLNCWRFTPTGMMILLWLSAKRKERRICMKSSSWIPDSSSSRVLFYRRQEEGWRIETWIRISWSIIITISQSGRWGGAGLWNQNHFPPSRTVSSSLDLLGAFIFVRLVS